jgi:hypothetical protein
MEKFQKLYEQFYNSDENFKSDFSDMKQFSEYVGDDDSVIEQLKEVYNFSEEVPQPTVINPAEPLKKKEDSFSELSSVSSSGDPLDLEIQNNVRKEQEAQEQINQEFSFGGPGDPKKKTSIIPLANPMASASSNIAKFEEVYEKQKNVETPIELTRGAVALITLGLSEMEEQATRWAGYWGFGDGLWKQKPKSAYDKFQMVTNDELYALEKPIVESIKTTGLRGSELGSDSPSLITTTDVFTEKGQEIRIPNYDENLIEKLSKPNETFRKALGEQDIVYNRVPNMDEIESFASVAWENYRNEANSYPAATELPGWQDVYDTKIGQIFKGVIIEEVKKGVESVGIKKEIDKEFIKTFGTSQDLIDDKAKEQSSAIISQNRNLSKEKAIDISDEISNDLMTKVQPIMDEVEQRREQFLTTYSSFYNLKTNKYEFQNQTQVDEFNKNIETLDEFIANKNEQIQKLKKESKLLFDQKIAALNAEFKNKIDTELKDMLQDNFSSEEMKKAYERGVNNYYNNKKQEENLAQGKLSFGDLGLSVMDKAYKDMLGGLSSLAEMYGYGANRFSTYLKDLSNLSEEIDASFLNPSVIKSKLVGVEMKDETPEEFFDRISTIEGLKEFGKDAVLVMAKQAPSMLPAVVAGAITKNTRLASVIAMGSDTGMQLNEIYNRVYRETGSVIKATEAARKQYYNQLAITVTYAFEMDILFNKMRINGFRDLGRVALIKSALETGNEFLFQETKQDEMTEKTVFELLNPGETYSKPFIDHYNFKTFADVAVGSGGMTTGMTAIDAFGTPLNGFNGQIRRENTKNSFLAELEQKGLASLVLDVNKNLGMNGALGLGSLLRLQGKLTNEQFGKFQTTIGRLNEFNEVNESKGISDDRSIAAADKMLEKQELLDQKEKAQTQEKKDLIDGQIKELDTKISDLQDANKEVELAVVKDIETGRVVYATDNESMNKLLQKNPKLATSLFSGIYQGVFNLDSKDSKLNEFIGNASSFFGKMQDFMRSKEDLRKQYNQRLIDEKVKRSKNKKSTLTDQQIETEYKTELQNLVNKFNVGVDVSNESLLGSQSERNATNPVNQQAKAEPIAFSFPTGMENKTSIEASETETLDAFIEANKNNPIASQVLQDVKTQYETYKSLFPNGKIVFHTSKESFTKAYNKYADVKSNELLNDNGIFIETEDGEIHINMPESTGNLNEYVVAHELTHAILLKAFGKKVYNEQGDFVRWEKDQQAVDDMQFIIENVASQYGPALNAFFKNRTYENADTAEEFVAQLAAMMSKAQSPLEVSFATKVLAAISKFLKNKFGVDVFANYKKESDAINFFNYIASQIKQGKAIDENNFVQIRSGFMIPKGLDAEALAEGNIETGTVVGMRKSSENLNSVLGQFTERPGTSKLAIDLPVKTLEQAIKEHDGAVLLIMSDNTGFFVKDDTGEFVMGGYGYMAAKANTDAGIGFASVNLGTVRSTMTNAAACRDGKPVLVLISLSAPKAALGNFYAQQYTFGALSNIVQTPKQSEEIQNSIYNALIDRTPVLKTFSKDSKLLKAIKDIETETKSKDTDPQEVKAANKMLRQQRMQPLLPLLQAEFDKNFANVLRSVDFTNKKSIDAFIKTLTGSSFSFPARQGLVDSILPLTEDLRTDKRTPIIKKMLLENGISQIGFHNAYGEPYFVGDQLEKDGSEISAPWGIVYGGFTLDPSADFMQIQSKGLTHPQFNAKVPGYDHFLLPAGYSVNENFFTALQFGKKVSIAQMASQGIQPGTRLPASNEDSKALTAEQRRAMLLDREMTPVIRKSVAENMQVMESLADQFSKRLGIPYEFIHDDTSDIELWTRTDSGKFIINTANATVDTPIYAYAGAFLEIIKQDNISLYTELIDGLLKDKNSQFYKDLQKQLIREISYDLGLDLEQAEKYTIEDLIKPIDISSADAIAMKFNINSNQFSQILEKVLLNHLGKIAAEQYDLKSGVYKALEKIWNEIVKIIKETFAFNKIEAQNIKFPSKDIKEQLMSPLQFLATQFADPRNQIVRDPDFKVDSSKPTETATLQMTYDLVDLAMSSITRFNKNVYLDSNGLITNAPIKNLRGLVSDLIASDNNLSKAVEYDGAEYEFIITQRKFPNVENPNSTIKSPFFFYLDQLFASKDELGWEDLNAVIIAYDRAFEKEILSNEVSYKNFRVLLRFLAALDSNLIDNIDKAFNGGVTTRFSSYRGKITKQKSYLIKFINNPETFLEGRYGANKFMNLFGNRGYNDNIQYLENMVYNLGSQMPSVTYYVRDTAILETILEFSENYTDKDNISQLRDVLKYSDFDSKVKQIANEDLFFTHSPANVTIDNLFDNGYENTLDEFFDRLTKRIQQASSQTDIDRYSFSQGYGGRRREGEFEMILPDGQPTTMLVSTELRGSDVNISFRQKDSLKGYGEIMEWGPSIEVLFSKIINKVFSMYQNEDVKSVSFTPVSDPVDPLTGLPLQKRLETKPTYEFVSVNPFTPKSIKITTRQNHELQVGSSLTIAKNSVDSMNTSFRVNKVVSPTEFEIEVPYGITQTPSGGIIFSGSKNIRKNLYNHFAKKKLAPFNVTASSSQTILTLPQIKALSPSAQAIMPMYHEIFKGDVSSIESTYKIRKSRAETLGKQSREIDADYDALLGQGLNNEQIFGRLFGKYSFEALRSSKYNAEFQSVYDMYVSEKAKEAWQGYSDSWNTRKDGIINFIDKYILENSLMDLVTLLRKGVRFITVDGQLLPEGESQSVVDANLATPYEPVGTEVKFNDLEIYSALFDYGIPQHNLDAIFGTNYRKTIENLMLDEDFDEEIKQSLSDDARASKIPMTFSQLRDMSEQLGVMNATAILNYINKHLSVEKGSPVMAAIQALVDRLKQGDDVTDAIAGELGTQIEAVGNQNIQALAEIGTAAGRILRILRELNKNKGNVLVDMLKDFNIKVSPAFEAEIKARAKALDDARAAFEKAKRDAINDFSDETIGKLKDAESALEQAEFDFAMITTDPRLQFRFTSDVISNRSALALLGTGTVVLSAVSNIENLLAKYGVNSGLVKRLVDRGIPSKIGLRAFPRTKEEYRNRKLAFSETKTKSRNQMLDAFFYGQIPGTAQTKFFENMARVNSVQDAINLGKLIGKMVQSFKDKNAEFTDLDFADTMQAMLIEHKKTGKLILADNKAYTIMGAFFRSLMQESELTGRLMAFGLDKFGGNIVAKKALLDYLTIASKMENENLPETLVRDLKNKGAFENQEAELRNMAILMEAIFRDERNNPFEKEGQRSVFFADNLFADKFLGTPRKAIRKAMISTYMKSLEAKAEDKGLQQILWGSANATVQALNVAQWTMFIFAKVPSNILMQILLRSNPIGATLNTAYMAFMHNKAKNDFYKKYNIGKEVPETEQIVTPTEQQNPSLPAQKTLPSAGSQAVTTTSKALETTQEVELDSPTTKEQIRKAKKKMNTNQKIQFQKDLANLFEQRRRLVTAAADIPRSVAFLTVVGAIAGSGAILSSGDDPDKKKLFKQLGIKENDVNISYVIDYLSAKYSNPNLTAEEFFRKRGGFNINRNINPKDLPEGYKIKDGKILDKYDKEVTTDWYLNITNFGTFTGYGLGYMAATYAKQKRLRSAENDKTEGFKEFFDMGTILSGVTGSVFRQTPSVKTVELFLRNLDPKEKEQNTQKILPNMLASTFAFTSPSLLGKPRSSGLAESSQFASEIEPSREDINIGGTFLEAHMNLSRNGVLGLGLAQSEFYKSEIGLFGENLAYRKTISEPGTFGAYLESTINFPSLRIGTGLETSMAADEVIKHQKVRSFLIDNAYLAQVYGDNGGDANMYWKMFNRPRKNTFVLTESEDNVLTNANFDKPFKLPNDIYRDELRILGEYMMGAMDEVKEGGAGQKVEDVKALVRNATTNEEANGYIEEYFQKMNERFAKAEADYKKDFLANRAAAIIRTMKDRNLLTENDMVILNQVSPVTDLKNVLESEVQPRWTPTHKEKPNRSYFDSKK